MGELFDFLSGADAKERGADLLREKFPAVRGLSAKTAADVAEGQAELADDGHPQTGMLKGDE